MTKLWYPPDALQFLVAVNFPLSILLLLPSLLLDRSSAFIAEYESRCVLICARLLRVEGGVGKHDLETKEVHRHDMSYKVVE